MKEPINMHLDRPTLAAMLEAMPRLRLFALSLCRDPDRANDLAQEALLRACANIDTFRAGSNMSNWLFTILRNQYYSEHRKRHWEVEDVDGSYAETFAVDPDQIVRLEWDDMRAALAGLPEGMRQALVLVAIEGLSYGEAAHACNCSEGTIKSRVHRARARLAAMFPGYTPPAPRHDADGRRPATLTLADAAPEELKLGDCRQQP
jgi:RNA polymerase sigma-70 factor, ECF subfamily